VVLVSGVLQEGRAHGETIWFLKRRADMSPADFHAYWRDKHGPLFCNSSAASRHVLRYEQNHATPENAAINDDFDGASVMWFRSMEDFEAMFADVEFQNVVMADGENFLDRTATKQLLCFAEEPFDIPVDAP
jgi:uncharacterized protein (TIGR02118 family)